MGCLTRIAVLLLLCWVELSHSRPHKRNHHHSMFVAAPRRFSRNFLESYAKKSIEEINKRASDAYRYVLLDVIGGRANEETKSLEIMAKFGRTRCQKTEDRYFCQTSPELRLEEKVFVVDISKKSADANVEFKFEEKATETIPVVQRLFRDSLVTENQ